MGKYTIFYLFENPRRGMQARKFTTNDPKILDLKSSSEQIFFRKLSLGAPASASAQNVQTTSRKISYENYTNLWTTKRFNLLLLLLSTGKISFSLSSSGS